MKDKRASIRKTRRRTLRNRSRRGGGKSKEKMVRVSNTVLRSRSVPRYIEKKADIKEVAPGYPEEAYDNAWKKVKTGAIVATTAAVIAWIYSVYGSVGGIS